MPTSSTLFPLLDYKEPQSALFRPSKAYMKSARRCFGPSESPMPEAPPTSGRATPMPDPDQTSSLTPAWDPTSRTPR
jgi:hypothetical protein